MITSMTRHAAQVVLMRMEEEGGGKMKSCPIKEKFEIKWVSHGSHPPSRIAARISTLPQTPHEVGYEEVACRLKAD